MNLSPIRAFVMGSLLAAGLLAQPCFAQDEAETDEANVARSEQEVYADLQLFGEVFDRIRAEYVDVPDERELIHAAINGMLTSLDPHSTYLDPTAFEETRVDTTGEFGGLGIEVTMEDGVIKVVSPIDDTPAARAGILPNDLIVELDGVQVYGMTLNEALDVMKGPKGTEITLTIVREGAEEPLSVHLVRDIIPLIAVRSYTERGVGVMRLIRFSEQAIGGIEKAVDEFFDDNEGKTPVGLILDLRNNPGGLVDQAIAVSDAFLARGAVVLTRGRDTAQDSRYNARADDLDARLRDLPLIVLINGGTASAAEIVAGALQDQKRATLVGTRSYGKGSVQSIISLGADGAMKLTTARYYTPNNRSIQAAGILPDIEVRQNVPEEFKGRDEIIGEAALSGQIGGGTEGEATTGSSIYVPREVEEDTQLQYAIDLILGERTDAAYPPKAE
ncbi:MAG: S41 family peptidase [Alphaproteobacteria bacterium]|nr:S41 family peptidase [Alphaproteobacteria bacterium]